MWGQWQFYGTTLFPTTEQFCFLRNKYPPNIHISGLYLNGRTPHRGLFDGHLHRNISRWVFHKDLSAPLDQKIRSNLFPRKSFPSCHLRLQHWAAHVIHQQSTTLKQWLTDFPAVVFHISHWYLSWNDWQTLEKKEKWNSVKQTAQVRTSQRSLQHHRLQPQPLESGHEGLGDQGLSQAGKHIIDRYSSKVTQYDSTSDKRFLPPPGCLQWIYGSTLGKRSRLLNKKFAIGFSGKIQNFNYKDTSSTHLSRYYVPVVVEFWMPCCINSF